MAQKYQGHLKQEIRPGYTSKFRLDCWLEFPNSEHTEFKCFSIKIESTRATILTKSDYPQMANWILRKNNPTVLNPRHYKLWYCTYFDAKTITVPFEVWYDDQLLGTVKLLTKEDSKRLILADPKDFTTMIELCENFDAKNRGSPLRLSAHASKLDRYQPLNEIGRASALKISDLGDSEKAREICENFELSACREFDPQARRG
jgi:hypothetical protein